MYWLSKTQLFALSNVNEAIRNNKFPGSFKLSDITPVYKKIDPSDKVNYRPVRVLSLLSKVFEKNFMTSFMNIRKNSWESYCAVPEKHMPHNMLFPSYFKNGRHSLTRWVMLVQFLWICLKHMTDYYMIYWLQN